ncbi:MBL fold metallo-hydrolase [Streptomyces sp. NPDC051976]|uniref:MBL fold metallo-hydrolase n=1 Tax=Streptomyces sp. NPDC051976 TaxID=3154947 RepID=UPI00344083FD
MEEVVPGVWIAEGGPGWGWSNAVLVTGSSGIDHLLFDCQFTAGAGHALADRARQIVPGGSVGRIVYSHANPDHTWGSVAFPDADIVASAATAAEMPAETQAPVLRRILAQPDPPAGSGAAYLQEHFGHFDFDGVPGPRIPTQTYKDRLDLDVGGREVQLLCVGPAHTAGDTVAYIPSQKTVLAGDILFIDDHAVSWGAPLTGWVRALDTLLALDAQCFIPGHGPVVGREHVAGFRTYLETVVEYGQRQASSGTPLLEAAAVFNARRRYGWGLPERVVTLLAAVYREAGVEGEAQAQLGLVGLIAAHGADLDCRDSPQRR